MPSQRDVASGELAFLTDGGTMGALIRAHPWKASPLGAPQGWPPSLKTLTSLMLGSTQPMFIIWGRDRVWLHNDAMTPLLGRKHPGALGQHALNVVWSEASEALAPLFATVFAGTPVQMDDITLELDRHGRAEEAHFAFSYTPIREESGEIGGLFGSCTDTTAIVMADRRRGEEVAHQRLLLQQMPGFVAVLSGPDHVFHYVNDAYVSISGARAFVGRPVRAVFPELESQPFFSLLDEVYATGKPFSARALPIRLTGESEDRFIDFVYEPIRDAGGAISGIFVGGYDVSAAQRSSTLLQRSEERLRFLDTLAGEIQKLQDADAILARTTQLVGEHMGVSICAYADMDADQDGFTIRGDWAAAGTQSILGRYSLADFGKLAVKNLSAGLPLVINDNARELPPEEAATFQNIGIAATICMPLFKTGQLMALMAIHDKTPRVWTDEELSLLRDVTERSWAHVERVGAEAELRASEENFRTLTRAMPNQAWTAQPDGMLDWFNAQVYDYSGAAPGTLDGADWTRMVHPDDLPGAVARWTQALTSGDTYESQFRLQRADGAHRWHIARAVPIKNAAGQVIRWIGTNTDIHDQKEAAATLEQRVEERTSQLMATEEALRQAQKMEAVGQLTGGIAHDFNNLLAGISGSLELLAKRVAEGRTAGIERYLSAAQDGARRAAALTQRLLAFSRRQTLDPRPLDVSRLITGMEYLVRKSVGPDVNVEIVHAGGLWATKIDGPQLENALLNLCINGRDAMAPRGGRLTIETANKWLDDRAAREHDLPPGQYVSLCVTDTGAGMPQDVIDRAFDPFFTTKPLGQGTGLGLSMVYGFVRQSGGQVRIYSELGAGTTMCLYLPRYFGDVDERNEGPASDTVERGEGEVVLVVDDEAILRMLMLDILQDRGYRAIEAGDGPSALKILDSDTRIDLLITDVGLPGGVNGRQVADAARRKRPNLKVLFITGYAENAVIGNGHLAPGMEIVTKPFEIAAFGQKVREMVER